MAGHRQGFAREHRKIDVERMGLGEPAIGRDPIPLFQLHPIAGHQLLHRQPPQLPIAPHLHLTRQGAHQGSEGAFRLEFLPEREQTIDQHHRPDRPAQLGGTGQEGQPAGDPQQQGHEMPHLIEQSQQQRPPPSLRQLVRPVAGQAPFGLRLRQAQGGGLQGDQHLLRRQRPDRLGGGELQRWRRRLPLHDDDHARRRCGPQSCARARSRASVQACRNGRLRVSRVSLLRW